MKALKNVTKKNSGNIRLWHWLNAIIISGSLLTVLVNSTIFDKKDNTDFITNELKNAGAVVSSAQAREVAHSFEDKIWDLHVYLGYFLIALFLYRLCLEMFQRTDQKFYNKLKSTFQLYFSVKRKTPANKKDLFIKLLYMMFYALIFVMAITGMSIKFDEEFGISKSVSHSIKEIHGFVMYLIIAFIVTHIIGVFIAERKDQKGIVSDMINGGEINE
ncbi:cytochrome b/b6 domain-containing protein [Pedobacter frigiditerrae]|uniref:cytochrome b/b6 domain-containing protein n=1 Tax=Pedobacter frigiditerrae TaxID=2530452 RepID=UPI00292FCD79|nr:cytochrome b/b6 domain-containing protein [Pedobacter frigiditerrae]